jgi:hypothetical protein
MLTCGSMGVKSCKVTIPDLDDVTHTVNVTAATLYEAVALGLATLRSHDWTAELVHGPSLFANVAQKFSVAATSQAGIAREKNDNSISSLGELPDHDVHYAEMGAFGSFSHAANDKITCAIFRFAQNQ